MEDIITILYGHSAHIEIIIGSLRRLKQHWPQMKYCICIDNINLLLEKCPAEFDFKYIHEYGSILQTYRRIQPLLEKIQESYIIFQADNNVLVGPVNNELFLNLFQRMKQESIHQIRLLSTGVWIQGPVRDNLYEIDNHYYMSVNMPMFKREAFLSLARNYPDCTWNCTECNPVCEYVRKNFKSYVVITKNSFVVTDNPAPQLCDCHFFTPEFPYVHLTAASKWKVDSEFQIKHIKEFCKEFEIEYASRL